MSEKYDLEQIRRFWTEQARTHGQSPSSSWSDHQVIEMEIRQIVSRLADGDRVLDIGCANGYSTVQFAAERAVKIRAVDYIPEMIEEARARLPAIRERLKGEVEFAVGDATKLDEPSDTYDKAIVIRVLINLRDWEHQLTGLRECARILKRGGLLLLSEATVQGWERMNTLRREWQLAPIPMPPFNQYLDQHRLVEAAAPGLECVEIVDFASTYFVGTRVLKPLLVRALGADIDVSNPDMEWNRFFARLPAWGDYGTQKLFVFRKR